jgi:hypothetical protein
LAGLPAIEPEADVRRPELTLATDGPWAVGYCPFDWVNPGAKVVVMRITPGRHQMLVANREAQQALLAGASHDDALRRACAAGSFAGPMRRNLVAMLDGIGLNRHLGIATTATLFTQHAQLLHSTSALLYPVFHKGENYTGPTRGSTSHSLATTAYHGRDGAEGRSPVRLAVRLLRIPCLRSGCPPTAPQVVRPWVGSHG